MEKLNIAEILKDCPKGMELYSPLCGKCVFDRLDMGTIICKKQNTQEITFTSEGYYMLPVFDNCECMIFPSENQRDWSTFQRPFKDGDIAVTEKGHIHLLRTKDSSYCAYREQWRGLPKFDCTITTRVNIVRLATEEEKEKLFKAIKANGYKWNTETKTLDKLIKPEFKVGDVIQDIDTYKVKITEVNIEDECYGYESMIAKGIGSIDFSEQDNWELVPNKFDITTLKPFESRVLIRDYNIHIWEPAFWGKFLDEENPNLRYLTTNGCFKYCIPYEGNEHLLGTTNDCDEYFKTWE